MSKKKPIILIAAIILAVVTAISASTFAWFTAQDEVVNRIETAKLTDGDVTIIETFDPDDILMPGVDINKDVGAINTGDAPALVRISFTEMLLKLKPVTGDMQVRNAGIYPDGTQQDTHIPEQVDISKFAANGWTKYDSISATVPWDGFLNQSTSDPNSDYNNMAFLLGQGITFWYKETTAATATNSAKYAWSAYAALGTTPETYQRVELRPELFNLVRIPGDPNTIDDDEFRLKVTLVDPAADTTQGGNPATALYPGVANGNNRFYNFITLELATPKSAPYTADWRVETAGAAPVAKTFLPASRFVTATDTMAAATDDDNKFLQLVFQSGAVTTDPTDVGKWFYNEQDGFFYFLGVVEPGMATNPMLLDAVRLLPNAESEYSHMKFDLTVKMDAIQATAAAITSDVGGGWGADYYNPEGTVQTGAARVGTLPSALITTLQSLCPVI